MATTDESRPVYGLAFETSSAHGSVALGYGRDVLETQLLSGPRRHAVEFLPAIDALCKAYAIMPASIRRVYVSSGPGSFTGLRIGITAARMIALSLDAQVVAIPTLEVIAQNALDATSPPDRVVVVLDAKRSRVYAAAFARQKDHYVAISDPVEADPARFLAGQIAQDDSCAVMGEGVLYHQAAIESSGATILPESLYPPRAQTVYRLGVALANAGYFDDRRTLIPVYVRPPEAEEKWKQRHR